MRNIYCLALSTVLLAAGLNIQTARSYGTREKTTRSHGTREKTTRSYGTREKTTRSYGPQEKTIPEHIPYSCRNDDSSCMEDAFCHKRSNLCVCVNGRSSYPMCDTSKKDKYCEMTPKCCNKRCDPSEMCIDGRCVCMYGRNPRTRSCYRCMERCKRGRVCKRNRRSGKYTCQRKPRREVNCEPDCGPESTCKRGRRGRITCLSCGPEAQLVRRKCVVEQSSEESWSAWTSWSACSATCKSNGDNPTKTKTRTCSEPGKCPGEASEDAPCGSDAAPDCPSGPQWSAWTLTPCTRTCLQSNDIGTQFRTRTCTPAGATCPGKAREGPMNCPNDKLCDFTMGMRMVNMGTANVGRTGIKIH